jgi:hypothetical protein
MEDEELEKQYKLNKEKCIALKERSHKFRNELESVNTNNKKLSEQLARINAETVEKLEIFEEAQKEGNAISVDHLHAECKNAIDFFLNDVTREGSNMAIRIEYRNMIISKNILDENMTFEKLKEETKLQFNKEKHEFYFADENSNVFLDELNVRRALFPFSKVKLKNYEPAIIVLDQGVKSDVQINKEKTLKKVAVEDEIQEKKKKGICKTFWKLVWKNIFHVINLVTFTIFLALWINSCIFFRNSQDYQILMNMFRSGTDISMSYSDVSCYKFF